MKKYVVCLDFLECYVPSPWRFYKCHSDQLYFYITIRVEVLQENQLKKILICKEWFSNPELLRMVSTTIL